MDFETLKPAQVIKHLDLPISSRQLHSLENQDGFGEVQRDKSKARIYSQEQVGIIAQTFSTMSLPTDFEGPMVYAVSQRKGGVGKTLVAYFMGRQFAQHGIKTIVIGLDEQESITDLVKEFPINTMEDLERYDDRKGLYEFFYKGEPLENVISQSEKQVNLYHIPETPELEELDDEIYLKESIRTKLFKDKLIPKLKDMGFQAIIFDCPPSMKSQLTKNALVASNHIVMPVSCDTASFRGFSKGLRKFKQFQEQESKNGHLDWKSTFFIPTKVKRSGNGSTISMQIHDQIKSNFGANVTTEMRFADIFEKANNEKVLPVEIKYSDSNAKALYEIIVDIFSRSVIHHTSSGVRQ